MKIKVSIEAEFDTEEEQTVRAQQIMAALRVLSGECKAVSEAGECKAVSEALSSDADELAMAMVEYAVAHNSQEVAAAYLYERVAGKSWDSLSPSMRKTYGRRLLKHARISSTKAGAGKKYLQPTTGGTLVLYSVKVHD